MEHEEDRAGPTYETVLGDLTRDDSDAIVNAANSSLLGGGGVDGAIHAAAGPGLLRECRELRATSLPEGLPVGQAVATGGHDLAARWVIHTVGPNWHRGQRDPRLLESCFRRSLEVAAEVGARTIAFPAISAGVYGWAPEQVARAAWAAVLSPPGGIERVRFVLFSEPLERAFTDARPPHCPKP